MKISVNKYLKIVRLADIGNSIKFQLPNVRGMNFII